MTDDPAPSTLAAEQRAQRRARRETGIARRERYFSLMASGYSCSQIAKMVQTSAKTVRREVDRALAERRLDAPERFAQVQVARLVRIVATMSRIGPDLGRSISEISSLLGLLRALDSAERVRVPLRCVNRSSS